MSESSVDAPAAARQALRARLLAARSELATRTAWPAMQADLAGHLMSVLRQLVPERLGIYSAVRSEFDAAAACLSDPQLCDTPLALPFSHRSPNRMDYRHWDRQPLTLRDECRILAPDGPAVVPDVVLAPCVGYTASGWRLGYGGGYFDRWMAAHPHATVVGVAWSVGEIDEADWVPQGHDRALACVVTERGVV
ncbi:MAG: 5-formyltetrahydrofolate cyclo-ligase [Rhizobacter sp.]|nr:5-formyltetrahydrofolate cyclo-ligase [Rhizobacter sp.]MBP6268386.1 5-formyltetrahydrofolate cyclo-ligase [Rhizobacter sp.]